MSGNRSLHHINILVDDLESTVTFYRDDLGLEPDATPEQGFPAQFFKLGGGIQIHINELADERPFRAHFAMRVDDFSSVFRHMKEIGAIDTKPWGNVRKLPGGAMQMFLRDPSGNLVEITSHPDDEIDADVLEDDLVDPGESMFVFEDEGR
ncbi:MAG: VOC family protein [Rhodospirillaceae bacterium]|nr:VOC family protein [Rhodospirillaceae bacterium]MBL6931590.1 VOC family protein [Rhodospirillales bacterium]